MLTDGTAGVNPLQNGPEFIPHVVVGGGGKWGVKLSLILSLVLGNVN